MKRTFIILVLLLTITACAQKPHPPAKSTMNPANAEATTAAFLATRQAKTALPTFTLEPAQLVILACVDCVAEGGVVNIWEFAGWDPGGILTSVPDQTTVQMLDTIVVEDGSIWYQVTFDGYTGWVPENFIREK